jgi:hypothetical protein
MRAFSDDVSLRRVFYVLEATLEKKTTYSWVSLAG